MSRKWKRLLLGVSSGILIVAFAAVLIARIPPAGLQLPPNSAPLLVVLTHPADESRWPADTPIPVAAMVTGQSAIQKVELWSDGRLFDAQSPPPGDDTFHGSWAWMPLAEGPHALFVRATSDDGSTADSNVVHIEATAAAGMLGVRIAQGGESLQGLAEQAGLPPEQLAAANPSLDPTAPVLPGTRIFEPVQPMLLPPISASPPPPEASGPSQPADEGSPSGLAFWLERALNPNAAPPAAPSLSASVGVCNVTLTIQDHSDSEDGFYVYALAETSASFLRIASLQAHSGAGAMEYVVEDQHGHVEFYVSAHSAVGESPSAPVAVDVASPQCAPVQPGQGGLQYAGGFLSLPQGVQLAYFYASTNGGAWQRIPVGHEFLQPVAGQVDLRLKIQQLLGGKPMGEMDLDVWGWSGGALVHVGQIHLSIHFASLAICNLGVDCSGDMGAAHWVTEAVVGSDQTNQARALRWSALGPDITYAIWQVSTQPFPPEYSVGAPPGLLISGISEAEVNSQTGVAGGDFAIDFKADLQSGNTQPPPALERTSLGWGQFNEFEDSLLPDLIGQWQSPLWPGAMQALLTQTLYIRVTPMAGGHPASDPSNSVIVTVQPTGPQPDLHIYPFPTYSVEIVPDSYVNEVRVVQQLGILGCSVITGVNHDAYVAWYIENMPSMLASLAEASYQIWADHIEWTLCPSIVELPEDTWYEQLATAFETFWNTLASTIEQVKGTLVDAIASIIPGCDATCRSLLMTGLNFTITYFTGLPPSMPDFDAAVEMGIDYAVQMAISQAGIPYCDATCQQQIGDEIQAAAADIAASGRAQPGCSAQNYTLWVYEGTTLYHLRPLCFPPGVLTEPVPGSMYEHAMVQVRVTRIDGMPQPAPAQLLVLDTQSVNAAYGDGHTEQAYFQVETKENCVYANGYNSCASVIHRFDYDVTHSAPLEGTPYPEVRIAVPALQAGQSVVIPVVFDANPLDYQPPNVYQPRLSAIVNTFPGIDVQTIPVDWWRDFVHLTDSTAEISITGHVLCQDPSLPLLWISPCSEMGSRQFTVP